MRATGVLVRFLSLLDVALILLGVLMIALMHAQIDAPAKRDPRPAGEIAAVADVNFVYLFAGWREHVDKGKFFLIGHNFEIGREISAETADDIRAILESQPGSQGRRNQVVMLLCDDDGWYNYLDAAKLRELEAVWDVNVVPISNVKLPQRGEQP